MKKLAKNKGYPNLSPVDPFVQQLVHYGILRSFQVPRKRMMRDVIHWSSNRSKPIVFKTTDKSTAYENGAVVLTPGAELTEIPRTKTSSIDLVHIQVRFSSPSNQLCSDDDAASSADGTRAHPPAVYDGSMLVVYPEDKLVPCTDLAWGFTFSPCHCSVGKCECVKGRTYGDVDVPQSVVDWVCGGNRLECKLALFNEDSTMHKLPDLIKHTIASLVLWHPGPLSPVRDS